MGDLQCCNKERDKFVEKGWESIIVFSQSSLEGDLERLKATALGMMAVTNHYLNSNGNSPPSSWSGDEESYDDSSTSAGTSMCSDDSDCDNEN